jgi:hypothetical protein
MVNITRLTEALRRCLWKQGFVQPEQLAHSREANGDHRFTVVIPRDACEHEPPATFPRSALGASVGTMSAKEDD